MNEQVFRYTKWKCGYCEDEFITDNKAIRQLIICECGKTSVNQYNKCIGKPIMIDQSNILDNETDNY